MGKYPRVYIVILNWNGWKDTIECLESIFRLDYDNYRVIVCDNDSSDGSLEYIKLWADGHLNAYVPIANTLRHLSYPPVSKKISYCQYDRNEAESGGSVNDLDCQLVLIQTGANLGFAGGNNVGLRYALARNDFEFVWLLNNDTVVGPDSLTKLIDKATAYKAADERVGLVGSKLMYYDRPDTIQAVGGRYNKWFATTNHLGAHEYDNNQYDCEDVVNKIDYPVGASMLATKVLLREAGLLCEDYFLYFEEIDWVYRSRKINWNIGYCWDAHIYHKEGGTIGSSSKGALKSKISDYYGLKNRIVFTKFFYPEYLWSVRLGFAIVLFNRIKRRQFERIKMVFKAL